MRYLPNYRRMIDDNNWDRRLKHSR